MHSSSQMKKTSGNGCLRALLSSLFFGLACATLYPATANAQTVRPLIDELGNPGKGRIEYVNDGLTPLNVILQPKSFTVSETGEISYRPLDSNVHLKLSVTSFRIQPQQTYYVFYEASSDTLPSWFVVYALFSGYPFRGANGMNVQLQLPHTIYLLPKQELDKSEVHISRADVDRDKKQMVLEVENTGDNFGRILQTQLSYSHNKQEAPGFPIFPHSRRILEVPLEADDTPKDLVLHFQNFKIEQKISLRSP
ncbi:MAG TPA: hypothetical protein VH437_23900 [Terriglobales bacterium]